MPSFTPKPLPPYEELHRLLEYDPLTGVLKRKISTSSRARAGDVFTRLSSYGYIRVGICNDYFYAQRLIFKMMEGRDPHPWCIVDHEDNVRHHNWWSNLREATDSQQAMNISTKTRNKSGYRGVFVVKNYYAPGVDGYRAAIGKDRKWKYLGTYADPITAHAVYCQASKELHGDFGRTCI